MFLECIGYNLMLISVYKVDNHRVDKLSYVRRICVVVLAPRIKNGEKENFKSNSSFNSFVAHQSTGLEPRSM